jgi:hypothetical protein
LARLYRQENENFLGKTYGINVVLRRTFQRTHWEQKIPKKKNPKKREEEGTQLEDDPFLGPRLKTIGFNLPTIRVTKYIQLWIQVPTKIHFYYGLKLAQEIS